MNDEVAIQQILNRYTEGCCRLDWDQVLGTFTVDGVWDVPGMKAQFQGHDKIRAVMAGFMAQMDYFVQMNAPAVIALDGDTATASTVVRECGKFAGRNEGLEILGRYEDALVRTPDGWRFTRRTFHTVGKHVFALQPTT